VTDSDKLLEVRNLSVTFGGQNVIEDINFALKDGESLIVVGPNGAGKSVLLRSLLNLIPHKGEIVWRAGARISYVPQGFFPEKDIPLSVYEFFCLKNAPQGKVREILSFVGLHGSVVLNQRIGLLSAGQFQRVMVAWSLVDDPHVLLFDEPTSGVDTRGEETIYSLLRHIKKERNLASILVTHDLSVIHTFADNVLCLNKETICYGTPEEISSPEILRKLYGSDIKIYEHHHG